LKVQHSMLDIKMVRLSSVCCLVRQIMTAHFVLQREREIKYSFFALSAESRGANAKLDE
jgi:hypothetical protein